MSLIKRHRFGNRHRSQVAVFGTILGVVVLLVIGTWAWTTYLMQSHPTQDVAMNNATVNHDPLLTPAGTLQSPIATSPRITHWNLMRGSSKAPITVVEYSDFTCAYCLAMQPILKELIATFPNDIRLVWKDLPNNDNPTSRFAHQAARCAAEQQAFWVYHDHLFSLPQPLTNDMIMTGAADVGLNMNTFNACLQNPDIDVLIDYDLTEAEDLGISGTPFFYINNVPLLGEVTLDEMVMTVKHLLRPATTTPAL